MIQALNRRAKEKDDYIAQLRYTVSVLQDKLDTVVSEPGPGVQVVQPEARSSNTANLSTTAEGALRHTLPNGGQNSGGRSVPSWVYQSSAGRYNSSPVVAL
jgi:hypothetical protein